MRKTGTLLALSAAVLLLSACSATGEAAGNGKKVTLWAGGSDNVKAQFEKQIENFNKTNKDGYAVTLQFVTSGTGTQSVSDRIIAAKKAGQTKTDFDLIEMGGDEILKYVSEGGEDLFTKLDKAKIPNIADLKFPATFRDDLVVPYRGTTVVLAYNSERVPNPPQTTDELYDWIRNNPGRFAYNTPGSGGPGGSFVLTSIYNQMAEEALTSTDEKWKSEWDKGFNLLKELHPYLYKSSGAVVYPNKNQGTIDLLANKEVDMIPAWADMIISQVRSGAIPSNIKVSQIAPSFTGNTVGFGIPTIGKNPEAAYAFINYMLSAEAQNIALDNMAAIPVIDFAKLDPQLTATISSLKIDQFRISSLGSLSGELNTRWDEEIGILK
jgi:putative spermidine/putrescine transport system substrate-binding protein